MVYKLIFLLWVYLGGNLDKERNGLGKYLANTPTRPLGDVY